MGDVVGVTKSSSHPPRTLTFKRPVHDVVGRRKGTVRGSVGNGFQEGGLWHQWLVWDGGGRGLSTPESVTLSVLPTEVEGEAARRVYGARVR